MPVDLHLSKALFSLDPDNLKLHCFLGLGALFCCSFFCPLDQPCNTLQTVLVALIHEESSRQERELKKFTVVCSRSPQNFEFAGVCTEQQRNVPKFITRTEPLFGSLDLLLCDLFVVFAVVDA